MDTKSVIGVFGGTFAPPHHGHLQVGRFLSTTRGLEKILYVVANDPWQKTEKTVITGVSDRLAMVELLLVNDDNLVASDVEIVLGGESVTAQTLENLQSIYPDSDLELILGYDAALGIESWRDYRRIYELSEIVVVDRPGQLRDLPDFFDKAVRITGPYLDISSVEIRERLKNGLEIGSLLPDQVKSYILENSIYGE